MLTRSSICVVVLTLAGLPGLAQGEDLPSNAAGLTYLHARYFDPSLGKFLSPDPVTQLGGVSGNRYAYSEDSPATYSDPGGRSVLKELLKVIKDLVAATDKGVYGWFSADAETVRLYSGSGYLYNTTDKTIAMKRLHDQASTLSNLLYINDLLIDGRISRGSTAEEAERIVAQASGFAGHDLKKSIDDLVTICREQCALEPIDTRMVEDMTNVESILNQPAYRQATSHPRTAPFFFKPIPNTNQTHKVFFYLVPAGTAAAGSALATTNKQANAQSPPTIGNNGHSPPQNTGSSGNSTPFGPPFPPPLPLVAAKCEIVTKIVPQPC